MSDERRDMQRPIRDIQAVRIGPAYDEHNVPYVRLTRTVRSGIGLGIGIAFAQLILIGGAFLVGLLLAGGLASVS